MEAAVKMSKNRCFKNTVTHNPSPSLSDVTCKISWLSAIWNLRKNEPVIFSYQLSLSFVHHKWVKPDSNRARIYLVFLAAVSRERVSRQHEERYLLHVTMRSAMHRCYHVSLQIALPRSKRHY